MILFPRQQQQQQQHQQQQQLSTTAIKRRRFAMILFCFLFSLYFTFDTIAVFQTLSESLTLLTSSTIEMNTESSSSSLSRATTAVINGDNEQQQQLQPNERQNVHQQQQQVESQQQQVESQQQQHQIQKHESKVQLTKKHQQFPQEEQQLIVDNESNLRRLTASPAPSNTQKLNEIQNEKQRDDDQTPTNQHQNQQQRQQLQQQQAVGKETNNDSKTSLRDLTTTTTNTARQYHTNHKNDHLTTTEVSVETGTEIENELELGPLRSYLHLLSKHKHIHSFIMFLWDKNGTLKQYTPRASHHHWLSDQLISETFVQTSTSAYGKVVLLFNNDVLPKLLAPILPKVPPIPILVYTIPNVKINISQYILIPTAYDMNNNNVLIINSIHNAIGNENFKISYDVYKQRLSTIVWRGGIHGEGEPARKRAVELSIIENEKEKESKSKNNSNNNNKLVWIDASSALRKDSNYTPEYMISTYKYHLDIGGVSGTSWGGLRWKMCCGGLVFKVNSWSKDLWHDSIEEWKHYIPVNADLSNLYEMYIWAESNPQQAFAIAQTGQQRCIETYSLQYSKNIMTNIIQNLPETSEDIVYEAEYMFQHHLDYFLPSSTTAAAKKIPS